MASTCLKARSAEKSCSGDVAGETDTILKLINPVIMESIRTIPKKNRFMVKLFIRANERSLFASYIIQVLVCLKQVDYTLNGG
jgi:hypothetical protein